MSELTNAPKNEFRKRLLITVSTLALLGSAYAADAAGTDINRPIVWISLGGQVERVDDASASFSPLFFNDMSSADLAPMVDTQRPSPFSVGEEGKITFVPEGSNWLFSAAIRYGHSGAARLLHHQANLPGFHATFLGNPEYYTHPLQPAGEGITGFRESHAIVDFQAGKDVGLGLFGAHGSSILSAGVRFAQFTASSHGTFHGQRVGMGPPKTDPGKYSNFHDKYHANYTAFIHSARDTRAFGPSVSWDASLPVAGNDSDVTLNIDWGANAAALFGRQRAKVHHQTTGYSHQYTGGLFSLAVHTKHYVNTPPDQNRLRSVMIANVGGFAGISVRYADAKLSFGYRGDFFFGAMDGGIDTRKSETLGFYGPFASVSVGIGG